MATKASQSRETGLDGIGADFFWNTRDWRTFEALRTETAEIKAFIKAFIKVRGGVL